MSFLSQGPGAPDTGGRSSGKRARAPPCSSHSRGLGGSLGGQRDPPLRGSTLAPPHPLAPEAQDGVHTFLWTQEVNTFRGLHLVRSHPSPGLGTVAQPVGKMARPPPAPMPLDGHWPVPPRGYHQDTPPPDTARLRPRHATDALGPVGNGKPRMPDRVAAMSHSNGFPPQDDRLQRRSRSCSPVSAGCAGKTAAEREERRLAEAAVLVRPPAAQLQAALSDPEPPAPELAPGWEAAPATQAAAPATPPAGRAPHTPPDLQHQTAAAAEASQAAAPSTPLAREAGPTRALGALLGRPQRAALGAKESREVAKYRAHSWCCHTHVSPP